MQRTGLSALALVLVVTAVGSFAWTTRTGDAKHADSPSADRLLKQVEQNLVSDPRRSAFVAVGADRLGASPESLLGMLRVGLAQPGIDRVVASPKGALTAAVHASRVLVTAGDDLVLRVWEPRTGALLGEAPLEHRVVTLAASKLVSTVASVDERGRLALWDVGAPAHPVVHPLEAPAAASGAVLKLAFSGQATQVLAVRENGEVERFDSSSGTRLPTLRLEEASGDLPWSRTRAPSLTAAELVGDEWGDRTALFVATAQRDIVKVELDALAGAIVVPASEVPGAVTSLAGQYYGSTTLAAGTSTGLLRWNETEDKTTRDRGIPVAGVGVTDDRLWIADTQGVSFIDGAVEPGPREPGVGRPATRIVEGPGGAVAVNADGTVSLLSEELDDLSLQPTDFTSVAAFGPSGELLTIEGEDTMHVDAIASVRPGVPGRDHYGTYVQHAPQRRYLPAEAWWPQGEQDETDWYVNDVLFGRRFVVASGQDPTGVASIFVWDAATAKPVQRLAMTTGGVSATEPAIVTSVAIMDKLELLAAYSQVQESVVLWSTKDWKQVATIDVGPAGGFSVSPDEKTIVVAGLSDEQAGVGAGRKRSALIFIDVAKKAIDHEVITSETSRARFSPDGRQIAVIGRAHTVRFLTADGRGQVRAPVPVPSDPLAIEWRPDGKFVAATLNNGPTVLVGTDGHVSPGLPAPRDDQPLDLSWRSDGRVLAVSNFNQDDDGHPMKRPASLFRFDRLRQRTCALAGRSITSREWRQWAGETELPRDLCPATAAPPPAKVAAAEQAEVAFQDGGELFVADAKGRKLGIGPRAFDEFPDPRFVWSAAGALAWTDGGAVHVLASKGSVPETWPCACSGVAFDGETPVAVNRDGTTLLRFGKAGTLPARVAVRGLPPVNVMTVGHIGGSTVVSAFETVADRGTPNPTFAVSADGRSRPLAGELRGHVTGPWTRSPDGAAAAFTTVASSGACFSPASIGIVDIEHGRVDFPPLPGGEGAIMSVRSLGYTADGELQATLVPVVCEPEVKPVGERYRLDGEAWVPTGERGYDMQQGGAVKVTAAEPKADAGDASGPLSIEAAGGRAVRIAGTPRGVVVRP